MADQKESSRVIIYKIKGIKVIYIISFFVSEFVKLYATTEATPLKPRNWRSSHDYFHLLATSKMVYYFCLSPKRV